ncbi:MAG: hypothetical protein AAF358_24035 [Pseudomonadota bacterium]
MDPERLLKKHPGLVHSELRKVDSHVQREDGEWYLNTVMLEGELTPFKYRRRKKYKNLAGARVNLTYYPATETVAGMEIEIMKVVRIRRS